MYRKAGSGLSIVFLCAAMLACAEPQNLAPGVGLTRRCIESIAAVALTNPTTSTIDAVYAGPLGLTPRGDSGAQPWRNKQAHFPSSDGTMHFLAIEGASWTKAVIMRTAATPTGPRVRIFVMDHDGNLLAAGRIENRRLAVLDIDHPNVRIDFLTEQALWRLAGADDPCGLS